ncbi:MAG: hypothetical protein HDT13_12720 [Butyrivibrio sp.]|nr:hypothetical protein [Butyrivibrio sp.]
MKVKLLMVFIIAMVMLSACSKKVGIQNDSTSGAVQGTDMSSEKIDVQYKDMYVDWMAYSDTEKLIDAGNIVVLGKVTGISFQMLDSQTAYPPTEDSNSEDCFLYTIYDVEVLTSYKGTASGTIKIRLIGGLKDIYLNEQLAALTGSDGREIPVVVGMPKMEIGENYLFVLYQYEDTMPTPVNPEQGMYKLDDPLEKDVFAYVSPKDIISYFGEDRWTEFISEEDAAE